MAVTQRAFHQALTEILGPALLKLELYSLSRYPEAPRVYPSRSAERLHPDCYLQYWLTAAPVLY